MTDRGELEERVRKLEEQQRQTRGAVETTLAASSDARLLSAGADPDVSEVRVELRAHRSALNALRADQRGLVQTQRKLAQCQRNLEQSQRNLEQSQRNLEQSQRNLEQGQRELRTGLLAQGVRLDLLERDMHAGFDEMRDKFATVDAGLRQIVTLLDGRLDDGS
jgi:hypothetical protein